jgi:hypothetical protein
MPRTTLPRFFLEDVFGTSEAERRDLGIRSARRIVIARLIAGDPPTGRPYTKLTAAHLRRAGELFPRELGAAGYVPTTAAVLIELKQLRLVQMLDLSRDGSIFTVEHCCE